MQIEWPRTQHEVPDLFSMESLRKTENPFNLSYYRHYLMYFKRKNESSQRTSAHLPVLNGNLMKFVRKNPLKHI